MRNRLTIILGALALALTGVAQPAVAAATQVGVCHVNGKGSFALILVSENAVPGHTKHGDGLPAEAVPNMDGFTFDQNCVPAQPNPPGSIVAARAFSVDNSGDERTFFEIEDTSGNGLVSIGDTVKFGEYPLNFTGDAYGTWPTPDCVLISVFTESDRIEGQGTGDCSFKLWKNRNGYYDHALAGNSDGFIQLFDGGFAPAGTPAPRDYIGGDTTPAIRTFPSDDSWLTVEIGIAP